MARLRAQSPLGNGDHDKFDFGPSGRGAATTTTAKLRSSPRKKPVTSYCKFECPSPEDQEVEKRLVPKSTPKLQHRGKQIRLNPLNTLTASKSLHVDVSPVRERLKPRSPVRSLFTKTASSSLPESIVGKQPEDVLNYGIVDSNDGFAEIAVEERVWCGSDISSASSDEELPTPRTLLALPLKLSGPKTKHAIADVSLRQIGLASFTERAPLSTLELNRNTGAMNIASSRPTSSSDKENSGAFLRFSPPRLYSPPKNREVERPVTPPQSPSKSRLQSPSKAKSRFPTPSVRPSLDAFWNADTVNDWNDQYSPQKILKSPKKLKFLREEASTCPTSSPRKCQSPSKNTKAEREAKRDFEARKRAVAEDFLAKLDNAITNGQIRELAATTGGVHFIWSKTLNSTAGRANWRKETTKTREPDGTTTISHNHRASIELAEKVIDDENRLLNVIAHEFCHLANFMISGIKDQPHGRQFKVWGRKCTLAFADRGVEVTTKHSYQIEYKYIWQCSNEDCGAEFKRHSKSIDPGKHTCGSCRGKLVQIKPAPRKDAGSGTGYAAFVKEHFAEVKKSLPGANQKEVMEAVGRKYRAEKAASKAVTDVEPDVVSKPSANVDNVARVLEFITIDDD